MMLRTILLPIVCIGLLIVSIGVEIALPWTEAEAFAEALAPRLGVPEDRLRTELTPVIREGVVRRIILRAAPMMIVTAIVAIDMINDVRKKKRSRQHS